MTKGSKPARERSSDETGEWEIASCLYPTGGGETSMPACRRSTSWPSRRSGAGTPMSGLRWVGLE